MVCPAAWNCAACMLLHDSAAVRLHGSLYSAAAAPRCGLVHVLACGAGSELGGRYCCVAGVSKNYTFNLITRKSIVVVGSFKLSQVFKKGERVPLMINYHYLITYLRQGEEQNITDICKKK